jgi:Flp pilus assembly protein TadD
MGHVSNFSDALRAALVPANNERARAAASMPAPHNLYRQNRAASARRHCTIRLAAGVLPLLFAAAVCAETLTQHGAVQQPDVPQTEARPASQSEFQTGASLTRQGHLAEAIPHLLAAGKEHADPYATGVNLSICYLGLGRYRDAIAALTTLSASGSDTATVENLLTQAYLGDGQLQPALQAFDKAAALTPKDEQLYAFVADAATDHHDYAFGLHAAETGLRQLPDSPRLHYERALFLARLDRLDEARPEFDRAAELAPGTYIADLALVQKRLYDEDYKGAVSMLRQIVKDGHRDSRTLSLLGTVLLQTGTAPGDADFAEAKSALEEAAAAHPGDSTTEIALGKIDSMEGRFSDAVVHLELGRSLEPENRSVYTVLAHCYRRLGELDKARQMEAKLAQILARQSSGTAPLPK